MEANVKLFERGISFLYFLAAFNIYIGYFFFIRAKPLRRIYYLFGASWCVCGC